MCIHTQVCVTAEVPDAGHMCAYLRQQHPHINLLPPMPSFNTVSDAARALSLFRNGYLGLGIPPGHIVVVTSDFHKPRAEFIFKHTAFKVRPRAHARAGC